MEKDPRAESIWLYSNSGAGVISLGLGQLFFGGERRAKTYFSMKGTSMMTKIEIMIVRT